MMPAIESIEVLKGPAAATLYGTEAARGVINIITKRGAFFSYNDVRMGQGREQAKTYLREHPEIAHLHAHFALASDRKRAMKVLIDFSTAG